MPRRVIPLNRDWHFSRGECPGAEAPAFDDTAWQRIGLPHCFDLPYFRTPEFYVGEGWYRSWIGTLRPPIAESSTRGSTRAFVEFDGVFQCCDVFVNGTRVGGHRGGYTGFSIDITDAFRLHNANLFAIRVDNRWDPRLAPRAGEHIFPGGVYRDVRLVLSDAIHVPWCGQVITTPEVSQQRATVRVATRVLNASTAAQACEVVAQVLAPGGQPVATIRNQADLPAGETVEVVGTSAPIARPLLWHPDHPHLYRVQTEVIVEGRAVDRVHAPLGFRWFEFTADRGFFLNGQHLYLRGANAHQDHAGWGAGITAAAARRDVRLIKEAGFNFVRGAHYPHHPAFSRACDEFGLLFWSEATFWGKGGFGQEGYWNASAYPVSDPDAEAFEQSCLDQLAEMIRIHRNHPSVIAWSMTNEAFFTYHLDRARALIARMVALSRSLDPTRPAAIGGAQRGGVDRLGDLAGYNGDGARLFIDPGVPNLVSEYGAISKPVDAFEPFFGDLQPEPFAWRSGQAIWCAFDYGSIAGRQGLKGIVRHDRLPKRSWHWYRRAYRGIAPEPEAIEAPPSRLRLEADPLTLRGTDATEDAQLIVTVLDAAGRHVRACPVVTLSIESGPGELPTGRSITFDPATDITIACGQAATAFRSYHAGSSVLRARSPGLLDATITINTEGGEPFVEGVTPVCTDRRYVPPPESEAARAAMRNAVNIALNRPCRASSESASCPARLANDGSAETCWLADANDHAAHWLLDLEGFYQLASVRLAFPRAGNWRFVIETSTDCSTWSIAIDRGQSVNESALRTDVFEPGLVARYLRLTFARVPRGTTSRPEPAGLAEVEVFGILSVR